MAGPRKKTPKKGKGKKKKTLGNNVMLNVDKAFYEQQIIDLNRKLARQRSRVIELEDTVTYLDNKLGRMNEDREDIINYLKRNLTDRNTEVTDLQLQVTNLSELLAAQKMEQEEQIQHFNEEYKNLKEQLTSKIKMLIGQLNALEDYRMHREELLQKFEAVQNELDAKDLEFRQKLYELEKKSVLGKANLKREMEERMFNLANKYQEANQIRIAATSQRIVRENIALNNEMNHLIVSTNDLDYENILLRRQFKQFILNYNILESRHKKTIHNFAIQTGVIQELTNANLKQKQLIDQHEDESRKVLEDRRKLQESIVNEARYNNKIKKLVIRLNAARYAIRDLQTQLSEENKYRHHLGVVIDEVHLLVKSTLFEHPELQEKVQISNEQNLLTHIIEILTISKSDVLPPTPYGTVSSVSMPDLKSEHTLPQVKNISERMPPIKRMNEMTYLGPSFEDFLRQQEIKSESLKSTQFEKEEMINDRDSDLITVSTSIYEKSSASKIDLDDTLEFNILTPTEDEVAEYEEENLEDEDMEEGIEENTKEEKMDEDDLDGTY